MLKKLLAMLQDNKSSWKLLLGALLLGIAFVYILKYNKPSKSDDLSEAAFKQAHADCKSIYEQIKKDRSRS